MKSKINEILKDIDQKMEELLLEYWKLIIKYGFTYKWGKIVFNSDVTMEHRKQKKSVINSILSIRPREIIWIPFIFAMFFPALFLDIMLFIYQNTIFRIYKIPLAIRNNYISYDKWQLDYLNIIQKFNCLYCSYVNWLFAYATEIWWRTEKYWCPIKHATKLPWWHKWEKNFADYWDISWFIEALKERKKY